MKVNSIQGQNENITAFKGKRVWKNTVEQLLKNNAYSLTEPNQRHIANSITQLGTVKGSKNIQFLLDSAAKVKYSTNITLQDTPKNDWKQMLLGAAAAAAALMSVAVRNKTNKQIEEIKAQQAITAEEREILSLREQLLAVVDLEQINNEMKGAGKKFERNLDYFIVSSETTLEHKRYVLERLNYVMSDEYDINPQLKDKKSIVVAEMINDMAISVPGNEIPNIKAVNQKRHGMCAAISIVRKKLAYEDKPNYVDSIISELDATDEIMVYDRNNLKSGKKIGVPKVPVDFNTALKKGYRIIDASTMHWMQIAHMTGRNNIAFQDYIPFDRENFDVNADSFYDIRFNDPKLEATQKYFQALTKTQSIIERFKARQIKKNVDKKERYDNFDKNIETLADTNKVIKEKIELLSENFDKKIVQETISELLKLEHKYSDTIKKDDKFAYIVNEEDVVKQEKIKNFLLEKLGLTNIKEETAKEIFSLVDYYNSVEAESSNKGSSNRIINKASDLYEIGAAFRYQILYGLDVEHKLDNAMLAAGLPDKETFTLNTIQKIADALKKDTPQADYIYSLIAPAFSDEAENKEELVYVLEEYYKIADYEFTSVLDEVYASMGLVNRKESLISYLTNIKYLIESGDKRPVSALAEQLNIKENPKTVTKEIDKLLNKLETGGEKEYREIFTYLGNTSQIENVQEIFNDFINRMNGEDQAELFAQFIKDNNMAPDSNIEAITAKAEEIQAKITNLQTYYATLKDIFVIKDENEDILFSADPKDAVIKWYENTHQLIPAKELRQLQEHLAKIDQARSADEFQSRRGKLKDKTLNKFTNQETITLKKIEKDLNIYHDFVQKQLPSVQAKMKESLEELKRVIGVQNGQYWVPREGHSGLYDQEEIRVLEYMTGRPHHNEEEIKKAVEQIKTSPYSGISTSSVFHDRHGWHAQYIADIAPVQVKTKDNNGKEIIETKDVLFHDNTWGASEHENTWVDSNGLMRTDYSDNRGGSLGYITNKKYQNGNFVDRILNDMVIKETPDLTRNRVYKRLEKIDNIREPMPQYRGILVEGPSPDRKNLAAQIHDAIFVPDFSLVEVLENTAKTMTKEGLKAAMHSLDLAGKTWQGKYEQLKKRIFQEFGNRIKTEEDYNKLPDNDPLKLALEKVAFKENWLLAEKETEIAKINSVSELNKLKTQQVEEAKKEVGYAFSKEIDVIDYVADMFDEVVDYDIDQILAKHNVKLTDKEVSSIGARFGMSELDFNGSARTTIKFLLKDLSVTIDKVVKNPDAAKELKEYFRSFLEKNIYFNESDLDNKKLKGIIKFIDRVYDPDDNQEFVKIYRIMQNMTTEEFNKEVLPLMNNEELGIGEETGFGILKRIRSYEEKANTDIMNTVYYDSLVPDLGKSESYDVKYTPNRFFHTRRYMATYDFTSSYRTLIRDLSSLNMEKLFNKYKDRNYRKHGVYPAYPKVDYISKKMLDTSFDYNFGVMEEKIAAIKAAQTQMNSYDVARKLANYNKKFTENSIPSSYQYKNIKSLITKLFVMFLNDESAEDTLDILSDIMELPEGTPWKDYKESIEQIVDLFTRIENSASKANLQKGIDNYKTIIEKVKHSFTEVFIQDRYKHRFNETMNAYERALVKESLQDEELNDLKTLLYAEFADYHILQKPNELVQRYILANAKDSPVKEYAEALQMLISRATSYSILAEVEEILMEAISQGMELNVKDLFSAYKIQTNMGDMRMSDKEILTLMINQIAFDNNFDTALMFLEKLGLGDTYVETIAKTIDFNDIKSRIDKAHRFATRVHKFKYAILPHIQEANEKLMNDENLEVVVENLKANVAKMGNKYKIKKSVIETYLAILDKCKEAYKLSPGGDKVLIFNTVMNMAQDSFNNDIQEQLKTYNNPLESINQLIQLIANVMVPEGSEVENLKNGILENYAQVVAYKQSLEDLQDAQ